MTADLAYGRFSLAWSRADRARLAAGGGGAMDVDRRYCVDCDRRVAVDPGT